MSETVPVRFEVQSVLPVRGKGRLVAMARVEVEIAGVVMVVQGFKITRRPDGALNCDLPTFKDVTGEWMPCITFPPELAAAIGAEILETFR